MAEKSQSKGQRGLIVKKSSIKEKKGDAIGVAGFVGKKPKNWGTALLLSICLGFLGVDRFYMGYVGTGILKLLITVLSFGLAGWIWWLIDIIFIVARYDFMRVEWI